MYLFFYQKWHNEISDIISILQIINSYLPISGEFGSKLSLIIKEQLNASQMEWFSLVDQLKHPMDKGFFKPWWVPIQINDYDLFIDLSSPQFSLFELHFYFIEPYKWGRNIIFPNIQDFILALDNQDVDLDSFCRESYEEFLVNIDKKRNTDSAYDYTNPSSIIS